MANDMQGYDIRSQFYEFEFVDTVDIPFITELIDENVNSILEIPCGVGRVAFQISYLGRQITAVDIEPKMVAKVLERIKMSSLESQIDAYVGNMCNFELHRKYDLIIVPREAFQLLTNIDDALSALKALKSHLNTKGKLMIDLFQFGQLGKNNLKDPTDLSTLLDYYDFHQKDDELVCDWKREINGGKYLSRSRKQYHDATIVTIEYYYEIYQSGNSICKETAKIQLRNYTDEEFKSLCGQAGLQIIEIMGNYKRKPWAPLDPRLIFILT